MMFHIHLIHENVFSHFAFHRQSLDFSETSKEFFTNVRSSSPAICQLALTIRRGLPPDHDGTPHAILTLLVVPVGK